MKINEELVVCKTTICGKEYETYIKAEDWKEIAEKFKNKTGYERVKKDEPYWCDNGCGGTCSEQEDEKTIDDKLYASANYYSSKEVAENNARADQLMRQLRRFAVEHRANNVDWNKINSKYIIRFGHGSNQSLFVSHEILGHDVGAIIFDSEKFAQLAIETYHDELMWYFTEYKDSL